MGKRRGRTRGGIFITVEGVEGSGKTTQCARLATLLRRHGCRVVETREPGGTPLAERVRHVLLASSREAMDPRCEALLILAARGQHVERVIGPALGRGAVVLCDRFSDSTLAYQGYARGLSLAALAALNQFATNGIRPDLTLVFDVPVRQGLSRRRGRAGGQNRLDLESRRFHEKVRRGYLRLAAKEPRRIKLIDGRGDPDAVAARVSALVLNFLKRRGVKVRK